MKQGSLIRKLYLFVEGVRPGGEKDCIYFVYVRCNTHVRFNIDAYIRYPYTNAYIECLAAAAAAGNNGDRTVVLGISATEQQRR